MDFLDPKKTKQHAIRLMIGYVLVTIAVFLSTVVLIYYAYGFAVNRQGELEQKGLVFVSSQPSGAQLLVNGKRVNDTNTKLNLSSGAYKLNIMRDGYRAWHRSIIVEGSSVDHYVYPLLFPKDLKTKEIKTYAVAPALTTQSPDRRFLLLLTDATAGTFDVIDQNENQDVIANATSFTLPEALMTTSTNAPTWEVVEWSSNNRHVLLKRTYSVDGTQQFEYILVDRQRPEGSHNLSTELTVRPTTITLRDKKPDSYYIYDASEMQLKTASLDSLTPKVLLHNVLAYKSHGSDTLVYVAKDANDDTKVNVWLLQNNKTTLLRNLAPSSSYALDIARYDAHWYVVIAAGSESRAYIYKDPSDTSSTTKEAAAFYALRVTNTTHVSFSANAQYILAQNGKVFHVYDIENSRAHRYSITSPIEPPQTKATWMDGNRLTYVSSGKQIVFDYDHINMQTLVPASTTHETSFDQQYRYMYSFTPNNQNGLVLSSTALRTPADL